MKAKGEEGEESLCSEDTSTTATTTTQRRRQCFEKEDDEDRGSHHEEQFQQHLRSASSTTDSCGDVACSTTCSNSTARGGGAAVAAASEIGDDTTADRDSTNDRSKSHRSAAHYHHRNHHGEKSESVTATTISSTGRDTAEGETAGSSSNAEELKHAIAKVHGYNNGGLEHFEQCEFEKSLKFHRRALRWAHRAESAARALFETEEQREEEGEGQGQQLEEIGMIGEKHDGKTNEEKEENQESQSVSTSGSLVDDIRQKMVVAGKSEPSGMNDGDGCDQQQQSADALSRASILVPMTLINIGQCHLARNELAEATECYERAISHVTSPPLSLPSDHPDVARIRRKLRRVHKVQVTLSSALSLQVEGKSSEMAGRYDNALDAYGRSLDVITRIVGRVHPAVASTLHKIGVMHWKRGKYNEALQTLSESLRISVQCYGDNHPDAADALGSIGMVHLARGDYRSSMKFYQVALRVRRETLGERHPDVARILIRIGMVYDEEGRHGKAMRLYRQGLDIQRTALALEEEEIDRERDRSGCRSSEASSTSAVSGNAVGGSGTRGNMTSLQVDVAATLNSIGVVQEKCGEYNEAMTSYEEALDIYRRALGGDNHVDVAVTLNNIGQIYRHLGQFDDAMDTYQKALKVMKAALGNSHRNVAATLHNIALVHSKRGELDEALELYKEVLSVQRVALGDEHPDVAVTLNNMGEVYEMRGDAGPRDQGSINGLDRRLKRQESSLSRYRQGKYSKAARLYKKALRVRRVALGAEHYYVALTLHKIGTFHYAKEGDYDEALRRFTEAVRIYRQNKIDDSAPQVAEAMRYIGLIRAELAKRKRADSPSSLYSFASRGGSQATSHSGAGWSAALSSDDDTRGGGSSIHR